MSNERALYFASTGAGSVDRPAICAPDGRIIARAASPDDAAVIVAALNGTS